MPLIIHKAIKSVLQQNCPPVNEGDLSAQTTPASQPKIASETTSLPPVAKTKKKRKTSGHTRPRQPLISLDQQGRLRVANLLAILNVSHSTLYAGLRSQPQRYPSPDGKDGFFPFWKTSTIRDFLES